MSEDSAGVVGRARAAAASGRWDEAYDLFVEADASGELGIAELPELATAAYGAGHLAATVDAWERLHAELLAVGEVVGAAGAAVRVAMHLLFDTALLAPVRGWLARADRLLGEQSETVTPAHAWLAVVRNYERMLSGDLEGARAWAVQAVEVGSVCDPAAAAIGRVAHARNRILEGAVDEGLALLDEAGVAATSGELDPLSTGVVYCELVCALQGLSLYDLAEQWTEAMEQWSRTNAIGSLHGRCRVHRAEILRLRGQCQEAEVQALLACEELRPYLRRELGWPLTELGRIRLHRGDLSGAEDALLEADRAAWDPEPVLALVRLAQGDIDGAARSIREALDRPSSAPSKELPPTSELRRAPLLEAQVEIAIAAGDLGRAQWAAEELRAIADRFSSRSLGAGADISTARVRLVEGDVDEAERLFSEGARAWADIGAPYETARARLGVGEVHRARGDDRRADLERDGARKELERLVGPADPDVPMAGERSTFRPEGDVWLLRFEGREVRVRELKGMRYLARLLAEPGRELHVLDLVGAASGAADLGDAGELLDATAKEAYRRRLQEIDADLDEARAAGDDEREAQADREREFLVQELSRAFGLGGRARRAGVASERARAGATRAIRQAIGRIAEHHPELGAHLERTIRTGTYCSYVPDPRMPPEWDDGRSGP